MESMIADGYITACLDITTTELADEVCGGRASAGPERGMAASRARIPVVIAPGCVDMAQLRCPRLGARAVPGAQSVSVDADRHAAPHQRWIRSVRHPELLDAAVA